MLARVVTAQITVLVRPIAYRLSNTFTGVRTGSSARLARPEVPQKNSTASPHSAPAAVRARATAAAARALSGAAGFGGGWAAAKQSGSATPTTSQKIRCIIVSPLGAQETTAARRTKIAPADCTHLRKRCAIG